MPIGLNCCCDKEPPDPPEPGCCCLNGAASKTLLTSYDCITAGGVWYPNVTCEEIDCGGGGGGGCIDGCEVIVPPVGRIPGTPSFWEILSSSYNRGNGNWSLTAKAVVDFGSSSGRSTGVVISEGGANAAITSHLPAPNFPVGFAYPAGTVVSIQGTSTPPTAANCGVWKFYLSAPLVVCLSAEWRSQKCGVETTCCPGKFIPNVLNIQITGGTCPGTGTMTWDGGAWRSSGLTLNVDLSCVTGIGWYLQVDFDAQLADVTCDPFSATASFTGTRCGDIFVRIWE